MAVEPAVLDLFPDRTTRPDADTVSDAGLVRRMVEGSQEALASLYERYGDTVFAAAMRTCRDRGAAAEVVQETFLTLWKRAGSFDPARGSLSSWLATIARNRAVDHLRAAARHDRAASFSSFAGADQEEQSSLEWLMAAGVLLGAAGPEPGPEMALSGKETRASIRHALASLAPPERCVIELAYSGELSQSEIAVRLGWPIGTVKTRTRRALRHLRDRLDGSLTGAIADVPCG